MFQRISQSRSIDKEFVLDVAQEHLTLLLQKYDHYFSLFTINTEQLDPKSFFSCCSTVSQRKNHPCLLEKTFLKYEVTDTEIEIQRCPIWWFLDFCWRGI